LVAHLQFFQTHKANQKTAKELPSQRTTTRHSTDKQRPRKKGERITRVWQKWRFSAPQTHLWLIKVWFSASTFVLKIATFAKPETVIGKRSGRQHNDKRQ
jgi:hypothetical protein